MRIALAWQSALALAGTLALAGCGGGKDGGGGGSGGDAPIADAGSDVDARLNVAVTLDGSQSVDPEGKPLSFTWSVLSAPEGAALTLTSAGAAAQVSFVPALPGTYDFGLTVSDGKKTSAMDVVSVDVELRIAVFGDPSHLAASALEIAGIGRAEEHSSAPDTSIVAAAGDYVLLEDRRTHPPALLSHRISDGLQEVVTSGEFDSVHTDGRFVVWVENRLGRWDAFARDLESAIETQLTITESYDETYVTVAGGFAVWETDADAGGDIDVLARDLLQGLTYTVEDGAGDQTEPKTDGSTVIFGENGDVLAFDVDAQSVSPIAATSAAEIPLGVSGDFVVVTAATAGTVHFDRVRLSDGARVRAAADAFPMIVEGDWVLYKELATDDLRAHRLSTGANSVVAASFSSADLEGNAVVWSDPSGNAYTRTLPAGTTVQVSTGGAFDTRLVSGGIVWDTVSANGVADVVLSADNGVTTTVLSGGKVFLADALDDYDVVLVGEDASGLYAADTFAAILAAGVPVLAADGDGFGLAETLAGGADYALTVQSDTCTPLLAFPFTAHPASSAFVAGSTVALGDDVLTVRSFDASSETGWTVIATWAGDCSLTGGAAIATFTSDEGTAILLDGAADDVAGTGLWSPDRLRLFRSELLWLASTRAP